MTMVTDVIDQLNSFRSEIAEIAPLPRSDATAGFEKTKRMHSRMVTFIAKEISPEEAERCKKVQHATYLGEPSGNLVRMLQSYEKYLEALIEEIEKHPDSFSQEISDQDQESSSVDVDDISLLCRICENFHKLARQLRVRHDDRSTIDISDEYDVQDLLHALLKVFFDDVRPEEWTPTYAGAASRMDFLLKNEHIVIETKMTRDGLKDKQIGEQLIVDIAKYKEHASCRNLLCFVYDPSGLVGNPNGLETDLQKLSSDDLRVKVLIFPK